MIQYTRLKKTLNDGKANGRRGTLTINGKTWHTVERMDGYKWLRPGTYDCEFGLWTSGSGKKSKAIRVLGSYSKGRIYIHPANYPKQLAGCIAPGKTQLAGGVGASRKAIGEIFSALGGWKANKKLKLTVEGDMYGRGRDTVNKTEPGDTRSTPVIDFSDEPMIIEV